MKKTIFFGILLILAGSGIFFWQNRGILTGTPAREEKKMYVVGVVRAPPALDAIWESFRTKMKEMGYEEGVNITYKMASVGKDAAETKIKVAALIDEKPDVLYPLGGLATHAAKDITDERHIALPIVFGITADPVKANLVKDLKNSGNNVTGVVSANEVVSSKRLELFLEAAPGIKRIVFPWNDPVTNGIDTFRQTARTLKLELAEKKVSGTDELDSFLASFQFRRGDALFRASDTISATRVEQMAHLALQNKIPFSGTNIFDVQHGALMAYGANYTRMGEQGAVLVDKILHEGKAPSELPIELPAEFDMVVNLTTARALGITVSPQFLARATHIIQ